jgi:L-ascorbate metabolism protein UlaG (beta-lactamase superfamily)
MRVKFYAHSCFRLEGDGKALVTDPYEPKVAWFDPIDEPADIVLMSSNTDRFHCDPTHVQGDPVVINALDIPAQGLNVKGLQVRAFPTAERFQLKLAVRGHFPRPSAMYAFTLGGVRVFHTGDIGRPLKNRYVRELRGNVDVMFAVTGAVHNISLDGIQRAIDAVEPKVVIPMHYFSPKGRLKILPVDEIAKRFPADRVVRVGGPEVDFAPASLPGKTTLYILEQSR